MDSRDLSPFVCRGRVLCVYARNRIGPHRVGRRSYPPDLDGKSLGRNTSLLTRAPGVKARRPRFFDPVLLFRTESFSNAPYILDPEHRMITPTRKVHPARVT
jgi:hypothetical protein